MKETVSFIGAGNMGGALIHAACRALDPRQVHITDYFADKAKAMADELGCCCESTNKAAVLAGNYIFMCVKPQVMGAAAMVLETGKHPGELKDAVCSPAGSTIVGVAKLEENGFRSAAIQAVKAGYDKNVELGKVK